MPSEGYPADFRFIDDHPQEVKRLLQAQDTLTLQKVVGEIDGEAKALITDPSTGEIVGIEVPYWWWQELCLAKGTVDRGIEISDPG